MKEKLSAGKWPVILSLAALIAGILIPGSVLAANAKPTNPRRKHIQETLAWTRIRERVNGRLFLASGDPTLQILCSEVPSAPGQEGTFVLSVENDDGSDWTYEFAVQDEDRDPNGYVYFSHETETPEFQFKPLTSGNYRIFGYLYRSGKRVSYASYSLAVSGGQTLEEKAQSIVYTCRAAGDPWQTALNLHDWLTRHTYYDTGYEYYGADVLFRGYGVCDSYSKAYELLCQTAGIDVKRVSSVNQNHAWNAISLDGEWYHVDVTWDDPSGETVPVSGEEGRWYYCLDDNTMALDHTGKDWTFTGCRSMDANYFIRKSGWEQFGIDGIDGSVNHTENLRAALNSGNAAGVSENRWAEYYHDTDSEGVSWSRAMKDVYFSIYVTGLRQTEWILDRGGRVRVNIDFDSDAVYVDITGWEIDETGTLTIPDQVQVIEDEAFAGTNATTVKLPTGCTAIGERAFMNSGVRTVLIPGGSRLAYIAPDAFEGCERIIFMDSGANDAVSIFADENGDLVIAP